VIVSDLRGYSRSDKLTERTFFRHFADKREVLFAGADALQAADDLTLLLSAATASVLADGQHNDTLGDA
jgi:hypothetical protein